MQWADASLSTFVASWGGVGLEGWPVLTPRSSDGNSSSGTLLGRMMMHATTMTMTAKLRMIITTVQTTTSAAMLGARLSDNGARKTQLCVSLRNNLPIPA